MTKSIENVTYLVGNLLDHPGRFIIQGCNAQGVMNSGVAKAIRTKYPNAFARYRETYERNGNELSLGDVVVADCGRHIVFNAITQDRYGYDDKQYVDYDAIKAALKKTALIIRQTTQEINTSSESQYYNRMYVEQPLRDDLVLATPLIGAGLGGGDWMVIHTILSDVSVMDVVRPVVYIKEQAQYDKIMKMFDDKL